MLSPRFNDLYQENVRNFATKAMSMRNYKAISCFVSSYTPTVPIIPPVVELSQKDLYVPKHPEFVAKIVIYTNNPVKSYYYNPHTSTLIDAGSSVGHAFVKVEDKAGNTVDVFEHIPSRTRGYSFKVTSEPIPSQFPQVDIKISNTANGTVEYVPNVVFRNKYLYTTKNYVPVEFIATTHDAGRSRDIDTLIAEAIGHNTIVAFKEPLTREDLGALRETRKSLKISGYNVRSNNCTTYPRAILNSCLTSSGRNKMNIHEMGPLLLNDISAHDSVMKAGSDILNEKGDQLYQHHSFNRNDRQKLSSFLNNSINTRKSDAARSLDSVFIN